MITGTHSLNVTAPLFGVGVGVVASIDSTFELLEASLMDAIVASSGHCGEGLPAKQMNDQ
jgi:hypothetical protein